MLTALGRGEPYPRWLLIFDNAEDEWVGRVIPAGGGHVLITARAATWGNRAQVMQLDVFPRRESIDHLLGRVPSIRIDDADRVAAAVGDLPVAVAAAGRRLSDTGMPVEDQLREIEQHGARALPLPQTASGASVDATWDVSLRRLLDRSPAAYRLLELCSVLAPKVALELVYSDQMAAPLLPFDRTLSEPLARGALVQQIHRLALLRLEPTPDEDEPTRGGNLRVHRLLQHAVRSRMSADELAATRHEVHQILGALRPAGDVDVGTSAGGDLGREPRPARSRRVQGEAAEPAGQRDDRHDQPEQAPVHVGLARGSVDVHARHRMRTDRGPTSEEIPIRADGPRSNRLGRRASRAPRAGSPPRRSGRRPPAPGPRRSAAGRPATGCGSPG